MLNNRLVIFIGLLLGLTAAAMAAPGSTPGSATSAVSGAQLYQQHCAACHGDSGHGGVGVPLALASFLNSVDDRYLRETIRHGRPGRVMPAFTRLSAAELEAIVSHIRSWQSTPAPVYSTAPIVGNPEQGANLYAKHCAACHGSEGQGGKGTGVTFSRPRDQSIVAPALNNSGFLAAVSDAQLKATLMQGRAGTPMQSFLKQGLSEQDINDLVSYIRSYASSAPLSGGQEVEPAVLVMESPYSLTETVEAVKRAATGKNFRLIRDQSLEEGLWPPEQQHNNQVIVYFCNFKFLNDALALDPRVGLFLPCRVTVVEQDGKVLVMSINPKRLSHLFNNVELDRACDEMYRIYSEILEEATL